MLKVDTSFKKGILLISIGGDLVKDTVSDLDTIIKLIKITYEKAMSYYLA